MSSGRGEPSYISMIWTQEVHAATPRREYRGEPLKGRPGHVVSSLVNGGVPDIDSTDTFKEYLDSLTEDERADLNARRLSYGLGPV